MEPSKVLAALADLAPAGRERTLDVSKGEQPIVWLDEPDRAPRNRTVDRLAALDALHHDERIVRRGWAWVLGAAEVDGARRKLRLPLIAEPVRLERSVRGYRVVPAGDLELTPLVADRDLAALLEAAPGLGSAGWLNTTGTTSWVATAADAAGFKPDRLANDDTALVEFPDDELVGQAIAALYVSRDVSSAGLRDTLLAWAGRPGLAATALAHVYASDEPTDEPTDDTTGDVVSPLPLNAAQREVVRRTRRERVVVVSGPPGNGKSHAVAAAALDTVHRGGSVLVATQSNHAAEVLGDLLRRYPGPVPVLFGNAERRSAFANELAGGRPEGVTARQLKVDEDIVAAAAVKVAAIVGAIGSALTLEQHAAELPGWEPLLAGLRLDAPLAFESGFDLPRARDLLAAVEASTADGWWRGFRRRSRIHRLRELTGAQVPDGKLSAVLTAVLAAVQADSAAARLATNGGTDLTRSWAALLDADAALAEAVGTAMRHAATSGRRWNGDARRSTAALAAALRTGRNRRREALATLDGAALVNALPLWIGTVTDVEDLLPPTPGLFDLVILDEAAHIDQIRAAPVLARARRALIVGDPRQLRFVSFVADVDVAVTLAKHGLSGDRVDVRRSSAFDVAVGATPVTYLDEHYRCTPHLIEFSAKRFYGDRLVLMTRHPHTEHVDAIDVIRVPGATLDDGVNRAEIDAVLATVRDLADRAVTGIGVTTPFRAQADALEAALLKAFRVDEIERLGLRSGTVHAFQGSEADTVVVSLGLLDGDSPARQRFVAEPNLFNVMVTRARQRLIMVTSLSGGTGLIGDYLTHATELPTAPSSAAGAPDTADTPDRWAGRLAAELAAAGHAVRIDYPVGRWTVDLVVGEVGLICAPHPDGPATHVERQRALVRAGWTLRDAFASRWAGDPVRAALDLDLPH